MKQKIKSCRMSGILVHSVYKIGGYFYPITASEIRRNLTTITHFYKKPKRQKSLIIVHYFLQL
jgi:hypothetical protein